MNIEEKLLKLLSEELATNIDKMIINEILKLSKNNLRKKYIKKIFNK